jgi:hypothetical protein
LARQTSDHSLDYFDFQGTLKKGYGKGKVYLHKRGKVNVLKSTPNKISFIIPNQRNPQRFSLIKTAPKDWLLLNHTPTAKLRPEIPKRKIKYKTETSPLSHLENPNVLFSPKIDGAANVFVLRKGRYPEAFSYRKGKNETGLIDHTFKLKLNRYKSNVKSNKPTVLWGETFAIEKNNTPAHVSVTSGLLNSNLDRTSNAKFNNLVYDVQTLAGKDISKKPFVEKLRILKDITKKNRFLGIPPIARTSKEKKEMYDKIKGGTHKITSEGLVLYHLDQPTPTKHKFDKEFKVYIKNIVRGKGKFSNSAGGYEYAHTPNGQTIGIVGGGFSQELRKDMWKNPKKYIGQETEVKAHEQLKSKALRMPIHIDFTKNLWPKKKDYTHR